LEKNNLPKVNRLTHNILRVLAKREKKEFSPHSIEDLIAQFGEQEGKFPDEVRNIKNFLEELDIDHIDTPVRKVTDFIQEDLVATSPSFLGEFIPRYQRLDAEHRKITNSPIKGRSGILKIAVIAILAVLIVVGVAYANEKGAFDGVLSFTDNIGAIGEGFKGIPSPTQGFQNPVTGGVDYSDDSIMKRYTPEQLRDAINDGSIDYNKLSGNMKTMVDSLKN
jgi:hypothetical protein